MKLIKMLDDYVNDKKFYIIYKNNKLDVVNYSEIVDFSSNKISVKYKNEVYSIEGNDLVISKMMNNEILITGVISKIIFEQRME